MLFSGGYQRGLTWTGCPMRFNRKFNELASAASLSWKGMLVFLGTGVKYSLLLFEVMWWFRFLFFIRFIKKCSFVIRFILFYFVALSVIFDIIIIFLQCSSAWNISLITSKMESALCLSIAFHSLFASMFTKKRSKAVANRSQMLNTNLLRIVRLNSS